MNNTEILYSMQSMELLLNHIREIKGVFELWNNIYMLMNMMTMRLKF
jgi:hypothetical protein